MNKKRIITTVVLGLLVAGAQALAQTPSDLIAIKDAARTALNAHDLDTFLSYLTEDAIFDLVSAPVLFQGKEQIRAVMGGEFTSFPDWHSAAGRRWAAPGIVVEEPTISGTHQGQWNGIPPTGNQVQLNGLEIIDFEGDKVKKITMYVDMTGEMVQLGVVAPGAPPAATPSFDLPAPEPTGLAPVEAVLEAKRRYNAQDLAGYARMFRADATCFVPALGGEVGYETWLAKWENDIATFPDIRVETTRTVDLGDGWVLLEGVVRGNHTGWGAGLPPSGQEGAIRLGALYQIDAQGLIQSAHFYFDSLGVMSLIMPQCPAAPAIAEAYIQDEITSPSLEGNVLGDSATRPLLVHLPPSYLDEPQRRYPTIYLLHGFAGDQTYFTSAGFFNQVFKTLAGVDLAVDVDSIVTELTAEGRMGEAIIVMPNALNAYGGSIYERSDLIGDYRSYIARDLVAFVDGKYRTIADPNHRAIAGHSMGAYGAISLALEYPDVFGAVAAMGPASTDLDVRPNWVDIFVGTYPVACGLPQVGSTLENRWNMFLGSFIANVFYATAAAWSPNLDKPPFYVDLPVTYPEKTTVEEVWELWRQRDLVHQVELDGGNLARTPVFVIEGRGPTVFLPETPGTASFLTALYDKGIPYTYATVPGDHFTHLRAELSAALEFLYPHIAP